MPTARADGCDGTQCVLSCISDCKRHAVCLEWQSWDALPPQHPKVTDGRCSATKNPNRPCSTPLPPYPTNPPSEEEGSISYLQYSSPPSSWSWSTWQKEGEPEASHLTCRSMPMCFKIKISGRAPAFVAPTPLDANSYDDQGLLVEGRTDVPACEGHPLHLILAAADADEGDMVRIFVEDRDEDLGVVSPLDLALRNDPAASGSFNLDFFNNSTLRFPAQCAGSSQNTTFRAYGARRAGDNMMQHHILALGQTAPKSVMSPYQPHLVFRPLPRLSIHYSMPPSLCPLLKILS